MSSVTWDLIAERLDFPEGPAFDCHGQLWVVELKGGSVTRIGTDGSLDRRLVGGEPNGLACGPGGAMWFCDAAANAVRILNGDEIKTVTGPCPAYTRPNDLVFDINGTLIFTTPGNSRNDPQGTIWSLRTGGASMRIADELYFPNGLALAPDDGALVVAETYRDRIWRGGWDQARSKWIEPVPWVQFSGAAAPDGMAFSAEGQLFVAAYGSGQLAQINPSGEVERWLSLPGKHPTNCAFDPSGKLGLVVTEAENGRVWAAPSLGKGAPLPFVTPEVDGM